jgi:hypothetical protein
MADLGEVFDAETIPASEFNGDPLPAGNYQVQITDSEIASTKAGNGTLLKLTLDVVEGAFINRKLWVQLCIQHTNETAQAIAQRALADIFLATNTPPSRESSDLHYKPFMVKVVIKKDEVYGDKNEVKTYKAISSVPQTPASRPAPRQAATPAKPSAPAASRPWGRNAAAGRAAASADDDIPF